MRIMLQATSEITHVDCVIRGLYQEDVAQDPCLACCQHAQTDASGQRGEILLWYVDPAHVSHLKADRVLFVGLGARADSHPAGRLQAFGRALVHLRDKPGVQRVAVDMASWSAHDKELMFGSLCTALAHASYRFDAFKTKPNPSHLQEGALRVGDEVAPWMAHGLHKAQVEAQALALVKDLVQQPPNVCTPAYMLQTAEALAANHASLSLDVVDEAAMRQAGMGAFLAVGQGSVHAPCLLVLKHTPASNAQMSPLVFAGKGITFDTGGLSLKISGSMVGMKYDMSGAATVMGLMQAVAALGVGIPVIGLMAVAENMIDARATRVDDVVRSLSGQTIEINNTDAEGRLVLCDTLTYAERFKPKYVVDLATLTGACVATFGTHACAVLGNHQPLVDALLASGEAACDRAWPLPLWDAYHDTLSSPVADMVNAGSGAGTITAACFLSKFTQSYSWAHLDIAGVAVSGKGKDTLPTGRPLPLLMHFVLQQAARQGQL